MMKHTERQPLPKTVQCIFSACKCLSCEKVETFHRFGCSCWDLDKALKDIEYRESLAMQYGFLYKDEASKSQFISTSDLQEHLKNGGAAIDPDQKPITLNDFKD